MQRAALVAHVAAQAIAAAQRHARPEKVAELAVHQRGGAFAVVVPEVVGQLVRRLLFELDGDGRGALARRLHYRPREDAEVQEPPLQLRHLARVQGFAGPDVDLAADERLAGAAQARDRYRPRHHRLAFHHPQHHAEVGALGGQAGYHPDGGVAQLEVVVAHALHRVVHGHAVVGVAGLDAQQGQKLVVGQRVALEAHRAHHGARPFPDRDHDPHLPVGLRDRRGSDLGQEVQVRVVEVPDGLLRFLGGDEERGGAARGGRELGGGEGGGAGIGQLGHRQDGTGLGQEEQGASPGLAHLLGVHGRPQMAPAAQLREEHVAATLEGLLVEQRAADGRPHVGRARHALHPPAMERPGLHQEDRGVVVQAGLDDRLEVSLRQQLLAQAVAVVEQLPVRRLPAGPGLDEAAQPRLGQGGAQLHGMARLVALQQHLAQLDLLEGLEIAGTRRPAEAQPLAGPVGDRPVAASLRLERDLAARLESEEQLVVLGFGRVQAHRIDELDVGGEVLPDGEARPRLVLARQQLGLDVHLVEPQLAQAARDLAGEAAGQQRGRLLAHDPGPAVQADVGPAGGDQAGQLFLRARRAGGQGQPGEVQRALGRHRDLDVLLVHARDDGLGAHVDVRILAAVVDEVPARDRELPLLDEDLPAGVDVQAAEGRRVVQVAADAPCPRGLQLRQVVADIEGMLRGHGHVQGHGLLEGRMGLGRGRGLRSEQRLAGEDVGVVEPALDLDVTGQEVIARLAREGQIRVEAGLDVRQPARRPVDAAHRIAHAHVLGRERQAHVGDVQARDLGRAPHAQGPAAQLARGIGDPHGVAVEGQAGLHAREGLRELPHADRALADLYRAVHLRCVEGAAEGEVHLGVPRERGLLDEGGQRAQLDLAVAGRVHGAVRQVDLAVRVEGAGLARDREAVGGDPARVEDDGDGRDLQLEVLDLDHGPRDLDAAARALEGGEVAVELGLAGQGARDRRGLVRPEGFLKGGRLHAAPDQAHLRVARGEVEPGRGRVAHERGQRHAARQAHRAPRDRGRDPRRRSDVTVEVHPPVRRGHERRAGGHDGRAAQREGAESVRVRQGAGQAELTLRPSPQRPSRARRQAGQVHVHLGLDVEGGAGIDAQARAKAGIGHERRQRHAAREVDGPAGQADPHPARVGDVARDRHLAVRDGDRRRARTLHRDAAQRDQAARARRVDGPRHRQVALHASTEPHSGTGRKAGQVEVHRRLEVHRRARVDAEALP